MASTLVAVDKDGNKFYLDILKGQPITADFNFKDITDLKTKGSHTYSFRLPSSETNDKYFATYFMVQSHADPSTNSNFDPYYKADAYLLQDTIEVFSGSLQLVNVFLRDGNRYEYEVILFSNNVSLMDELKGVNMSDIDFSDYNHLPSNANIFNSYDSDSIAGGDCVYSFFDYGNGIATSEANDFFIDNTIGAFLDLNKIDIEKLRPQIRLSSLITKVLAHKGYTFTSNFFSDATIRKIYCDVNYGGAESLISNTPLSYYKVRARNTGTQTFDYGDSQVVLNCPTEDVDLPNNYNPTTNEFNIQYAGTYQFIIKLNVSGQAGDMGASSPCRLAIMLEFGQNDLLVTYAGNEFNIGSGTEQTITAQVDTTIPIIAGNGAEIQMISGQKLKVVLITPTNNAYPVGDVVQVTNASLQINLLTANITDGQVSINQLFGNLKVIDFFSSVIRKFNLVVIPDKNNSKHLFIEPYDNYMNATPSTKKDWSKKIDFTKDIQIVPPNKISGREALFRDTPSDDYIYQSIARGTSYTVGEFTYNIGNKFSEKVNEFTSVFSPTINYPIQDVEIYTSPVITVDGNGYKNVGGIRLSFYHGKVTLANSLKYALFYDNGTTSGSTMHNRTVAPYFSAFSEKGFDETSTSVFTINWGCTWGEQLGLWESLAVKGLALKYWLSYIINNFDKNARMLVAYVRLTPTDIQDFNFNDTIIVNGDNYVVNSIKGYPINSAGICKVELIKTSITFGEFPLGYNVNTGETCPSFNNLSLTLDMEFLADGSTISETCCNLLQETLNLGIYVQNKCWYVAPVLTEEEGGGADGELGGGVNNNVVGRANSYNFLRGGSIQGNNNNVVNGGRDIKINGNSNNIRSSVSKVDITGDSNVILENSNDVTIVGTGNIVKPASDNFTVNFQDVVYNNTLKNIRITGDYGLALNNNEVIVSTSEAGFVGTSQTVEHIIRTTTAGGSREAWVGQLGAFTTYPVGTTYNGDLGANCFRLPAKTLIKLTITLQATTGGSTNTLNTDSWELVKEYKILSGTAPIVLSSNQVTNTQTTAFSGASLDLHPTSNIPYLYNAYLLFMRLPFSTLVNETKYLIKTQYTSSILSGTVTSNILPSDITGLKLWLDASNFGSFSFNSTVGNAQPITQWNDLSGGANNLLQNQSTYMPLWYSGAGVGGGRPYVDFDGTTAIMFNTDADLVGLASSNNTFIVVFESDKTTAETFGQVLAGVNTSSGTVRAGISINTSSTYGGAGANSVSYYNENTTTNMFQCNISSAGVTDKKIVVGRRDGTNLDIIDENGATDTYSSASDPTDAHYFTIGGRFNGSVDYNEFEGRIHEVICYNKKISDADRDKLIFYLKNKWNIQ